jgi:4-carboxymuconolactone decarboxylase
MEKESIDEKEKEGYEEIFTGQTDLTELVDTFDMSLKMYLKDAAKIYDRPQLDIKTRELCTISALMSLGVAPDFILHDHLSIAVSIATVQEVRELIVQAYWITGWPSLMRIFDMFNRVLEEKKMEKNFQPPRENYEEMNWCEEGVESGRMIHGDEEWSRLIDKIQKFEPAAADFLIENIYGKIFNRPSILDVKIRHLCFIAALTVLDNMPILKIFISGALNVGCTPQEIKEVIFQMSSYGGWPSAINAIDVFNKVIEERK